MTLVAAPANDSNLWWQLNLFVILPVRVPTAGVFFCFFFKYQYIMLEDWYHMQNLTWLSLVSLRVFFCREMKNIDKTQRKVMCGICSWMFYHVCSLHLPSVFSSLAQSQATRQQSLNYGCVVENKDTHEVSRCAQCMCVLVCICVCALGWGGVWYLWECVCGGRGSCFIDKVAISKCTCA